MNYTFQRVAAFCGLRLSYYATAAMVALAFFALILTEYRTASPLYILLTLAVLPSLVKAMFFSDSKKQKREPLSFPLFCKKFHYDHIIYQSMNLSYLLLFLLFAAWHISYSRSETVPAFIAALPGLIAGLSLLIRILGVFGYRLYFHLFPLKAMR